MAHCGLAAAGARKEADVVRAAAVLDTVSGSGLVASRVNIAIIYPVSTTQQSSDATEICHESVLAIYNSTQLLMIPDANENGIFTLNNHCNMLLCWCGQFQHLS